MDQIPDFQEAPTRFFRVDNGHLWHVVLLFGAM